MPDVHKSFDAWQQVFVNLDASEIGKTYHDAIESRADCLGDINFHSAAIDRLLEHAWLNPELTDGQRRACAGFATRGIELVDAIWAKNEEAVERFHKAIEAATEHYRLFGTTTVREFMVDRGLTKF